jgi:hypothetical protein
VILGKRDTLSKESAFCHEAVEVMSGQYGQRAAVTIFELGRQADAGRGAWGIREVSMK